MVPTRLGESASTRVFAVSDVLACLLEAGDMPTSDLFVSAAGYYDRISDIFSTSAPQRGNYGGSNLLLITREKSQSVFSVVFRNL
jgi:hypothetical protein